MSNALREYTPETNISLHKDIRFHPSLSSGEKMFFAEIQSMAKATKKGHYPFSSRKLSEFFGVSHQTILNWVKKLVEHDLLEVGIDYNNHECRQFLKPKDQN